MYGSIELLFKKKKTHTHTSSFPFSGVKFNLITNSEIPKILQNFKFFFWNVTNKIFGLSSKMQLDGGLYFKQTVFISSISIKVLQHSVAWLINTLGTGSTNLPFYGSAVVDRRDKFVLLRHVKFENTYTLQWHHSIGPLVGRAVLVVYLWSSGM
jgi:hypothetical protein